MAYALGGFYIVHVKHMPIVDTACWIPLVWLSIELGLERNRRFLPVAGVIWAIQWLAGLEQRQFVGAESRLKLVFDLLEQIERGSETDPATRIAEPERRRLALDRTVFRSGSESGSELGSESGWGLRATVQS